ncbi:unnamed protein product [Lactuca virosa]|uniref:Uncharacterized protein n=1 Tax=Lactuca virosa TaxID=75947 RepID=A0AAU9LQW0_9ASTR|nr:unnamed protein product [Lactuca virosa]
MSRRPFPRRRLCLRAYDCSTITVEVQYTRSLADCKGFTNMQCRNLYLLQASNHRCMMSTKRRTGKRRQRQRTLALLVVPLLHPPSSIQGRWRPLVSILGGRKLKRSLWNWKTKFQFLLRNFHTEFKNFSGFDD